MDQLKSESLILNCTFLLSVLGIFLKLVGLHSILRLLPGNLSVKFSFYSVYELTSNEAFLIACREQEAREKYEDALREKDKMAVENEKLKAEVDRLKKELAKQKQDVSKKNAVVIHAQFIAQLHALKHKLISCIKMAKNNVFTV